MKVILIAAVAKNGAMGRRGRLPWSYPEDLMRFKELTEGKIVVMGRKTAESLRAPLCNRINIVITRNKAWTRPGFIVTTSMEVLLSAVEGRDIWVIGGAELYSQFIDRAEVVHLTVLDHHVPDADTFFPMDKLARLRPKFIEQGQDSRVTYYTLVPRLPA
jgi:dihydrofolate reductase